MKNECMCLKSVLFPVLTLPNLAVKAFYVLIFFQRLYVLIFEQQKLYGLISHVLRKEWVYLWEDSLAHLVLDFNKPFLATFFGGRVWYCIFILVQWSKIKLFAFFLLRNEKAFFKNASDSYKKYGSRPTRFFWWIQP